MISIIDYGTGNLFAISNIFKKSKISYQITNDKEEIENSSKFILPGVGSFDKTMQTLTESGILDTLYEQVIIRKKPLLGICVGMQILSEHSEEGYQDGLGWIKGKVKRFDKDKLEKLNLYLPHMGWNSIEPIESSNSLLHNLDFKKGFYFLHNYFFEPEFENNILAASNYGNKFACIVGNDNIYGVQFHPEKSHINGVQLLMNFANI